MKQARILVGAVALIAFLAAVAQNAGEYIRMDHLGWLFGSPQDPPTTAPTGKLPTDPALGARPAVPTATVA